MADLSRLTRHCSAGRCLPQRRITRLFGFDWRDRMALRASQWTWIVGLGLLLGTVLVENAPAQADEPPKADKPATKQPADGPKGETKSGDKKDADTKPADKTA